MIRDEDLLSFMALLCAMAGIAAAQLARTGWMLASSGPLG